ncbi:MAG: Hpt domain-containing protein [Candidatus Velthaea sp.]|jgi:HPt (histidine-containing phosphotransfer) domain-containing protein
MPDDAILDLARLREVFEDDEAGIVELLEMALGTGGKHVAHLKDALAAHDAEGLHRAAHGIKGSASNIGALQVARISAEIEEQARNARWDGISELVTALDAAYAALREHVRSYRAEVM